MAVNVGVGRLHAVLLGLSVHGGLVKPLIIDAGVIFDVGGGGDLAAGDLALDQQRAAARRARRRAGGETGRASADDGDIVFRQRCASVVMGGSGAGVVATRPNPAPSRREGEREQGVQAAC
jgi:hypothetical protein